MIFTFKDNLIMEDLKPTTARELIKHLTLVNPEYSKALKRGRPPQGIEQYLQFYEFHDDRLSCPRGFSHQAYRICHTHGEKIQFVDQRRTLTPVQFTFTGELRALQQPAVDNVLARDFGLLSAGTGAGKTVMGIHIIAERGQPALVVVHTRELLNQWIDRIEQFLAIPREEVGIIGGGKFKIGDRATVAMVQSLYKRVDDVVPHIGHLVVDECHRAPSRIFTEAVRTFDCKYMTGLTATPWRRDGLSKVIFWHIGDVTGEIEKQDLVNNGDLCPAEVRWVETEFNSQADASGQYSQALSELTTDEKRNHLIAQTVSQHNGHGISLILSDRKEHCNTLRDILSQEHGIEAGVLTGATPGGKREQIIADLKQGACRYLIATSQLCSGGL